MQPEQILLLLNLTVISIGYIWVYPRVAGSDIYKVTINDLIASISALVVAGVLFWETRYEFTLLFVDVNWFLITYLLIEIPFMIWYLKRYKVLEKNEP